MLNTGFISIILSAQTENILHPFPFGFHVIFGISKARYRKLDNFISKIQLLKTESKFYLGNYILQQCLMGLDKNLLTWGEKKELKFCLGLTIHRYY